MTRPKGISGAPVALVADGQWPDGDLSDIVPARYAQVLARNLRAAIAVRKLTQEEVCRRTGVERSTLWGLLSGQRWPDMITISRLEWGLGQRLWPLEEILLIQHAGEPADLRASQAGCRQANDRALGNALQH